jgi:DNA-binding transcriptional MerR regulator
VVTAAHSDLRPASDEPNGLETTAAIPPGGARGYTISELAEASGVPERTIRFYRQSRLIDAPQRIGRHAFYASDQLAQVRTIAEMRSLGLGLEAIGDLLKEPSGRSQSLAHVLRISDELRDPWIDDRATRLSRTAVLRSFGVDSPNAIPVLEHFGLIKRDPGRRSTTYTVPSVRTLQLAGRLVASGVDPELAARAWHIMSCRLGDLAVDLIELFAEHAGQGFARSGTPDELQSAFAELQPIGLNAVQLLFAHAIDNALGTLVERSELFEGGNPPTTVDRDGATAVRTGNAPRAVATEHPTNGSSTASSGSGNRTRDGRRRRPRTKAGPPPVPSRRRPSRRSAP